MDTSTDFSEYYQAGNSSSITNSPVHLAYTTTMLLELVVGVPANASLILLVVMVRELRTAPNLLLANLAVSDLIFLLTFIPISVLTAFKDYIISYSFCRFQIGVYYTSFAVSSLSLTVISLERYIAIVRPLALRQIRESRTTLIICAIIWFISIFLFGFIPWYITENEPGYCVLKFHSIEFEAYFNIQVLALYIGPMICMTICYGLCTRELVCKREILVRGTRSRDNSADRSRRRVAFNLMLITFLFAICWFPNYAFFYMIIYFPHVYPRPFFQHLGNIRQVLYYLASCINPLVLYAMSSSFRLHLVALITCSKNGAGRRRNGYTHTRENTKSITLKSAIRMQETTSNTAI